MAGKTRGLAQGATLKSSGPTVDYSRVLNDVPAGQLAPVAAVAANPHNPVERMEQGLESLAASIAEVGLIHPLLVATRDAFVVAQPTVADQVPPDAVWVVLDGHRRLAAARIAGVEQVPHVVRDDLAGDAEGVMVHTSRERLGLTPIQEARIYQRLLDEKGMTQRAIATHAGVSQSHVAKRLSLLRLPSVFQDAVVWGWYTLAEGVALASETDEVLTVAADRFADLVSKNPPTGGTDDEPTKLGYQFQISSLVSEARYLVTLAGLRDQVAQEGVEFVDDPRHRFGQSYWRHQLHTDADIDAARQAGTLVASVNGQRIQYYTTVKPAPMQDGSSENELRKAARGATKAREPFVELLLAHAPTAAQLRLAMMYVVCDSPVYSVWDRVIPAGVSDRYRFRDKVPTMTSAEQDRIMWQLFVAHCDEQLRSTYISYGPHLVWFMELLESVGYALTDRDRQAMPQQGQKGKKK